MNQESIAKTIARKLGGFKQLKKMVGAANFLYGEDKSLLFDFNLCREFNRLKVRLMPDGNYEMTFYKIARQTNPPAIAKEEIVKDLLEKQLQPLFEAITGLKLTRTEPMETTPDPRYDWLRSLNHGDIVYHSSQYAGDKGKLYFRKFVEDKALCSSGYCVVTSPDKASLDVNDEGYLSCHGLIHCHNAFDIFPTESARLAAIAEYHREELNVIAQEAEHHTKKLTQMMLWLEFPELEEFTLHWEAAEDSDLYYKVFIPTKVKEGMTLEQFLLQIGLEEEWTYDENDEFCGEHPGFLGFEPGEDEFHTNNYSRPTHEEIVNYIHQRDKMTYRNFSRQVTASPCYSFSND